ncbi:MAG: hypothetical protein ACRC6U_00015 [Fusobacteriaceae bacterium]
MNISLGEREVEILQFFIDNSNREISLENLIINFDFNLVNIKNSLNKIDNFLIYNSFPSLKKDNKHFFIRKGDTESISALLYTNFSPCKSDRISYLIFKLITEEIVNLTEISEYFKLNRKTLQLDLYSAKEFTQCYNLEIISINSKGLSLHGDLFQKYQLFIKIVLKILSKRVSPLQQEIYSLLCSPEDRIEILEIIKSLPKGKKFSLGRGIYYEVLAVLLINKKFSDIFPSEILEKKIMKFSEDIPHDIINPLEKINVPEIQACKLNLSFIFAKLYFRKDSALKFLHKSHFKFIEILEKEIGIIPEKQRYILFNILKLSTLRKNVMLDSYGDDTNDIDDSLMEILKKISSDMNFQIYNQDLLRIYFFIKSCVDLEEFFYKKKSSLTLLLLDGSLENWIGESIKKSLLDSYYIERIDVINFFEYFSQSKHDQYSFVLKLEIPPTFFPELPQLNWKAFLRDPNYMENFGLEKKQ